MTVLDFIRLHSWVATWATLFLVGLWMLVQL